MSLSFAQKTHVISPDMESIELVEFLLDNTIYIDLTFGILSTKNNPNKSNDMEEFIELFPEFIKVENESELEKYKTLISKFYNCEQNTLNQRKGKPLELIIEKLIPKDINPSGYINIITEGQAFFEGKEVLNSKKDIDIIFEYESIELFECKSNLEKFLYPEVMKEYKKDKLKFMKEIKIMAQNIPKTCYLFLPTYSNHKKVCEDRLSINGFKGLFEVLTRKEIISRL